jgi:hypothetical protein
MRTSRVILIVVLVVGAAWASWVWFLQPWIITYGVAIHQKNVTRELAEWGEEDSKITDDASAIHAAEMVGYMSQYYVPGPGYRGPADVEAALQTQRQKSIARVVAALERYTGLRFGADPKRWAEWAQERQEHQNIQEGKPADPRKR